MKIHTEYAQGSVDWMIARSGIPTASEFDQLLTPEWKIRTGQMPQSYLARKIAEWWLGGPLPGFNVFDTDQGHILEDEAKPWFTLETGREVQSVGLITSDDDRIGCSPDGLLGEDGGIEIKCPAPQTHVGYLLSGEVPKDYLPQVHGAMFVSGRPKWTFLSYRRNFPALIVEVERDDEIQDKIAEALALFLTKFEEGKKRLCEINGGPPKRTEPAPKTPEELESEHPVGIMP